MIRTVTGVTALLVGVLLLAGSAAAQFEIVGGATYNTYSFDWEKIPLFSEIDIDSGFGAYGGAQYWVNDTLAVGAQFDYLTGSGQDSMKDSDWDGDLINDTETFDYSATGTGYLGTVTFDVPLSDGVTMRLFAAAGMYGLETKIKGSIN